GWVGWGEAGCRRRCGRPCADDRVDLDGGPLLVLGEAVAHDDAQTRTRRRQGFERAGEGAGLVCNLGTPEADALHGHRHGAPPGSLMRPLSASPVAPGRRCGPGPGSPGGSASRDVRRRRGRHRTPDRLNAGRSTTQEREAVEVGIARVDLTDAVLAHQDRGVGVVDEVARGRRAPPWTGFGPTALFGWSQGRTSRCAARRLSLVI